MAKIITVVLLLVVALSFCGCTNESDTRRVLADQGFTDINITGYKVWACGEDYTFHTGFAATAPITHRKVTGVVCSGFMKGNSIKFD